MKYRRISLGLELGSAAVEQRLTEIALLMHKTFPDCYWEQDATDGAHHKKRMHIVVNGRDGPLCFTDRELINYSTGKHHTDIDHRMYEVLSRLLDA